jgi:DNA-binding MarR family transcriptional regulator
MTTQTYVPAQNNMMSASDLRGPIENAVKDRSIRNDVPNADHPLLEVLFQTTLRLRLRGMNLESSTGLSGRELDLVALLNASGQTSIKSLVADLELPRSTMTAIVDRLEARGLVKRLPNPLDRRSVILEATPSANAALLHFRKEMMALVQHLKAVLSENEQTQLTSLILKIDASF